MATDTLCPEVDIDLSRVDLDVEIINPDLIIQAGIIASSGPQGPPGPQGIQGVPGIQGPPGQPLIPKGTVATSSNLPTTGNNLSDMWVTADTGHAWVWNGTHWVDMGPFQGPTGLTGPAGATGNPGSAATIAVGTTTTGAPGSAANVTNTGSSSAAVFAFTVPQGPVGTTGATGPSGPQGATGAPGAAGAQGAQGPAGPQGPPGGASANTTLTSTFTMPASLATGVASVANAGAFGVGGVVYIQGLGYLSVTAVNTGANQLTLQNLGYSSNAAPGSTAPATTAVTGSGPQGPTGPTGPQGPSGATGAQGPIGNTGPTGATGAQGAQGIQGAQGPVGQGYTWRGVWSNSVSYNSYDTVSYQGSSYVCISPNTGQLPTNATYWNLIAQIGATGATGSQGATGGTGPAGVAGAAATIAAGTATSLAPGSNPTVNNSGSSSVAVFNFGIPQGATGATGAAGGIGPAGPSTPSADSGNLLAPGSDSLLYLPPSAIQPTIWDARLRSYNSLGNPNFEVSQIYGTTLFNPTVGTFKMLDRWLLNRSGSGAFSGQQISGTIVLPGTNFAISQSFLRLAVTYQTATLAATDRMDVSQVVEGPYLRELNDVHSISLLVRSSIAGTKFGVTLQDSNGNHCLPVLCAVANANTWTLITLPNLPLWTGTFTLTPGSGGYYLIIGLAEGSTNTAPSNGAWLSGTYMGAAGQSNFLANAVGSTFDIAFVQHEPGPQCTTLQDKPFAQNLDECLRYYTKSYLYTTKAGTVAAAGQIVNTALANGDPLFYVPFKKTMAKTPTVTGYNPITGAINSVRDYGATLDRAISATFAAGDSSFGGFNLSNWNAATSSYLFHYTADTGW